MKPRAKKKKLKKQLVQIEAKNIKPKPPRISPRGLFCSLPDYVIFFSLVLIPFDYRKTANVAA